MYCNGVLNKEKMYIFCAAQWRCTEVETSESKNTLGFLPTFLGRHLFCRKCPLVIESWAIQKLLLLLSTSSASWICDVAFFSFHTSNLEFTVSKKNSLQHVLITCVLVTTRSPCLSIRCSVLLKCFIEVVYGVCKFATQPRCQEMLIPGFPTCTLVLSVQRGVAVMGEDSF